MEVEIEKLKKQTPQELVDKLNAKEKEIAELKAQLEQLKEQQTAKIETPPKNGSIKNFFKFGLNSK